MSNQGSDIICTGPNVLEKAKIFYFFQRWVFLGHTEIHNFFIAETNFLLR